MGTLTLLFGITLFLIFVAIFLNKCDESDPPDIFGIVAAGSGALDFFTDLQLAYRLAILEGMPTFLSLSLSNWCFLLICLSWLSTLIWVAGWFRKRKKKLAQKDALANWLHKYQASFIAMVPTRCLNKKLFILTAKCLNTHFTIVSFLIHFMTEIAKRNSCFEWLRYYCIAWKLKPCWRKCISQAVPTRTCRW